MDVQKLLCVHQDIIPFGAEAHKREMRFDKESETNCDVIEGKTEEIKEN